MERINLSLSSSDWNVAVSKTVDVLQEGGLVCVPTETVYGLAVRLTDYNAVKKLLELKGRSENHPFALAFPSAYSIEDIVGELSPLAQRLARRCLPGPISLVLDIPTDSIFWKLPAEIQQAVSKQSAICCRIPDHPLLLPVLGELNEPIVLTSANKSGQGESINTEQIIESLGHGIDLLLDEGPLSLAKPSTVVKVVGNEYTILREGVLKSETVKRLAALMILFVCADNTCRSPMAEYLCEKMLAERLNCPEDALEQQGVVVLSAGINVTDGKSMTPKAIETLRTFGVESAGEHRTLLLSEMYVRFADYIFAMTRHQRESVLSSWCNVDSRLSVLRPDGSDIADPAGGSMEAYRVCAEQIQSTLRQRLADIFELSLATTAD